MVFESLFPCERYSLYSPCFRILHESLVFCGNRRNFLTLSFSQLVQFPNFIVSVSINFDPYFIYLFIDFICISFSCAVCWNQSEGYSQWRLGRRSVLLALTSSAWRWRFPRFAMDTMCKLFRFVFFEQSHHICRHKNIGSVIRNLIMCAPTFRFSCNVVQWLSIGTVERKSTVHF